MTKAEVAWGQFFKADLLPCGPFGRKLRLSGSIKEVYKRV